MISDQVHFALMVWNKFKEYVHILQKQHCQQLNTMHWNTVILVHGNQQVG